MYDANGAECTDDLGFLLYLGAHSVKCVNRATRHPAAVWLTHFRAMADCAAMSLFGGCFLGRGRAQSYVSAYKGTVPFDSFRPSLTCVGGLRQLTMRWEMAGWLSGWRCRIPA